VTDATGPILKRGRRRVGTSLRRGKYALEALIGAGSTSAVYEASHRNGARVAIKLLHEELSQSEALRARFLREGYLANKVQHPGLVRVLDDDVDDDGATFLVMELVKGSTVEAEWEAGDRLLAPTRVVDIALALLDVLQPVHAAGLVHTDIKPSKLFLTSGYSQLKLLDLGIARLLLEERQTNDKTVGTPGFVAPERAAGRLRDIDARTDLYSVGALMFALLSGHVLHEARTPKEAMALAAKRPAPAMREACPGVPSAIAQVVDVALCFEKERRWSTALEMRAGLDHAARFASRLPSVPKHRASPAGLAGKASAPSQAPAPPSAAPLLLVKQSRKTR
jgi:eukaryotic-like serine/threonine-protein kinase